MPNNGNWSFRILLFPLLAILLGGCATTTQKLPSSASWQREGSVAADELHPSQKLAKLPAEKLVELGNAYLGHEKLGLAKVHFALALEKDSSLPAAYYGLGEVLRRQGNNQGALEAFAAALKKESEYVPALLGTALVLREQGDCNRAVEFLSRARVANPADPEILTELGITYGYLGHEDLAEPLFKRVVKLLPNRSASHNNLGFNYILQRKYAKAIEEFSWALALAPKNTQVLDNLATAYFLNGDENKARDIFEKSLGKPGAYNNIGYLYSTKGKWEKSKRALTRALDASPTFYLRAKENLTRLTRLQASGKP